MKCGKCGAYINSELSFCTSCNTPVSELEMKNMLIKENKEEEVVNMPEEKLNDEFTSNETTNVNQFNVNTNEQIIDDVASELPIIEDTPAVENIQEGAPVTEIEPVTVIEPTPVVEPVAAVAVEPTPVVESMPEVTVAPTVEQMSEVVVEPTPITEPVAADAVEPTPIVEAMPEVTVTTTMEEAKPFVEENTVVTSSDVAQPVITSTETPTSQPTEQTENAPKKKSALPLIIVGVVAAIAVVVVIVYLVVIAPKMKPSYAFEQMIKGFKSGVVNGLKESKPVKYDITLKPNIIITGTNADAEKPIADIVNKFDLSASVYNDSKAKELYFNLDAKYNNKKIVVLDYIEKEKMSYLKADPIFAKYIAEAIEETEETEKTIKNEDIVTILNGLEEAYFLAIKEEYYEKTDATVKVNGEDVAVKANTLNLNETNIKQFVKDAAKTLSENDEFIKAVTPLVNELMSSMSSTPINMVDEMEDSDIGDIEFAIPELTEADVKNKLKDIAEGKDTTLKLNPIKFTMYLKGKDLVAAEVVTNASDVRLVLEGDTTIVYTSVIKDNKKTGELAELLRVKIEGEKYNITLTSEEEETKYVINLEMTLKQTNDYKVQKPADTELYTEAELMSIMGQLMTGDMTSLISASEGLAELMAEPLIQMLMQSMDNDIMGQLGLGNLSGDTNTTTPEVEEVVPEEPTVSEPVISEPVQDTVTENTTEPNTTTASE